MYIDNDLFESVDSCESEVCGGFATFDVRNLFGAPLGSNNLPYFYNPASYTSPYSLNLGYLPIGAFGGNYAAFNQVRGLLSSGGGGFGLGALSAAGATFAGGARAVPVSVFW
jgi:hypothetical protein